MVESIKETRPYLTFELDEETYAVDVGQVREILDTIKVTRIPRTPDFMLGVINLRGSVVPVIDMRLKFGLDKIERTVDTVIVVLEIHDGEDLVVAGALVDKVEEVFELDPEQIEPAPKIGTKLDTEFIKGMGRQDDNFIIILDIDKIFTEEEIELVKSTETLKSEIENE